MDIPAELLDILHRIVHSSGAAETERIALHGAIDELDKPVIPPANTEAKESE